MAFERNVPQKLTDGVFLTGGRVTRSHIATWTRIVVLDAPNPDVTLLVKVQQLRSYILSVLSDHRVPNVTKGSWFQRLQAIESQIPHSKPIGRRTRRAFFDFVDTILNKVFGVATEALLDATRRWIQQVRSDNQRAIHKTNELVTVVNHTFTELLLNREHILDIEAYIAKLHDRITRWTAIFTIAFERVRASLRIDQCLSALKSVYLFWIRQLCRHQRQRAALESGILTGGILPTTDFVVILATSRRDGRTAPRLEWSY